MRLVIGSLCHLPTKYDFGWWTPVSDTEIFCLELFSLQMFALHFCLSVSSLDVISDLICTWSLQRRDKLYTASSSICVLSDVMELLVGCSSVPRLDLHGISVRAECTSLPLPRWKCSAMCCAFCQKPCGLHTGQLCHTYTPSCCVFLQLL